MMNSLDLLLIAFCGMTVVSFLAVIMQFLLKDEKKKKAAFYFLAVWSLVITWCNVQTIPEYMTGSLILAFAIGALGIGALLLQLIRKDNKAFFAAQVLVAVSVVAGMADTFIF